MDAESKRTVEVHLIVVVVVRVDTSEFIETLKQQGKASVAELVAAEIVSNLESVPYVEFAITTQL